MSVFVPIRQIDKSILDKYNAVLSEYKSRSCEYSYANLYAWQDEYNTQMCDYTNFFAVKFEIDGQDVFLPPVAKNQDFQKYFDFVKAHCKNVGKQKLCFCGFSKDEASFLEEVTNQKFFYEDRGNFDYLYDANALCTFSGKKLHSKKNHVNKFLSLYKDRYSFEKMTQTLAKECIGFNKIWEKQNEKFLDQSLVAESKSAKILLENFDKLSLLGAVLKVDGNIVGYTVGGESCVGSDTLVVHIEKGLYEITGVYPMLFSMFVQSLDGKFFYINREDDLDDEGLRKSKLSYNPCAFVEKYSGEIIL